MKILLPLFALIFSVSALAAPAPLNCPQRSGQPMDVNNDQVLQWKKKSATEFVRSRAHITGSVVKVVPPGKGINIEKDSDKFHKRHQRYQVQIGPEKTDTIDVFYNGRYGPRPALKKGDKIEACGEFAADSSPRTGEPFAVVYWVHAARLFPHTEGFMTSRGKVFGREIAFSEKAAEDAATAAGSSR